MRSEQAQLCPLFPGRFIPSKPVPPCLRKTVCGLFTSQGWSETLAESVPPLRDLEIIPLRSEVASPLPPQRSFLLPDHGA